jgi:hypothetical protein
MVTDETERFCRKSCNLTDVLPMNLSQVTEKSLTNNNHYILWSSRDSKQVSSVYRFETEVLNLICAMDRCYILVKLTDPFLEKCISIHKTEIVRFITVKKHFCSPKAINYFLNTFIIERNAKFYLEVSENTVLIFFPSKWKNALKSMYPIGVRGFQVKNHWSKVFLPRQSLCFVVTGNTCLPLQTFPNTINPHYLLRRTGYFTHIYIYVYTYVCVCVCVCV